MIFINTLKILEECCYKNFEKAYKEIFKQNINITEEESKEYALHNTIKALEAIVVNNDYSYFSREDNIREQLINVGIKNIKIELLKHVVKVYSFHKKNNIELIDGIDLSDTLNEKSSPNQVIAVVHFNLVKYGVDKTKIVLDKDYILKALAKSFVIERLKKDKTENLDLELDDASNFLLMSIESYFSKSKEV